MIFNNILLRKKRSQMFEDSNSISSMKDIKIKILFLYCFLFSIRSF